MICFRHVTLIILLILLSFNSFAYVLLTDGGKVSDNNILRYTGSKSAENPMELEREKFVPVPDKISLGYLRKPQWFLLQVENASDSPMQRLVVLHDGFMYDSVVFYQVLNGKIVKITNDGINVPASKKEVFYSGAVSRITIPPRSGMEIFIQVSTLSSSLVSVLVKDYTEFYKDNEYQTLFLGSISAALLAIALYNLFLFFSLRLKEYIYYFLYVVSAVVFFQAQTGFMVEFYGLYGDARSWMFISVYLMGIFLMLFSQQVLETRDKLPFFHRLTNVIIVLNLLGIGAALVVGMKETLFIQTPFTQLSCICLAALSVAALYKRVNSAWYYFFADGVSIIGIFISSLFLLGYLDYNFFTRNAYFMASVAEAILLSWLLSYRINSLRTQKIDAQESLIALQKSVNQKLEEAVIIRTEELRRKNEELHNLSIIDELTGLYNRRFLMATFSDKMNKKRDDDKLLTFMMLDIDYFKNYNDKYGHHAGDDVLKRVSGVITHSYKRSSDYVFRIGGEEFVALYLVDSVEDAVSFAETVRQNLEQERIEHCMGLTCGIVTCSIGLFAARAGSLDFETIYRKADEQLYLAKESGRNRVCADCVS
ncbi:MAG: diguanylate cyclase [Deferribacterales bacterium]